MNAIHHHIPPHLAHCVRTHRIATQQEDRSRKPVRGGASTQSPLSKEKRAENARRGKTVTPEIERLIRVCWALPFTITTLIEKAELMGSTALSRKVYQSRLAKMVNRGVLTVVGKSGLENLYQATARSKKTFQEPST